MSSRLDALYAAQKHHDEQADTEIVDTVTHGVAQSVVVRVAATPEEVVATAKVFLEFLEDEGVPEIRTAAPSPHVAYPPVGHGTHPSSGEGTTFNRFKQSDS